MTADSLNDVPSVIRYVEVGTKTFELHHVSAHGELESAPILHVRNDREADPHAG